MKGGRIILGGRGRWNERKKKDKEKKGKQASTLDNIIKKPKKLKTK